MLGVLLMKCIELFIRNLIYSFIVDKNIENVNICIYSVIDIFDYFLSINKINIFFEIVIFIWYIFLSLCIIFKMEYIFKMVLYNYICIY